jgi:hypothetical protein
MLRLTLTLLALVASTTPALAATEGAVPTAKPTSAQLAAERAERAAKVRAERLAARAKLRAEREAKAERARARREALSGTRRTPFGYVIVTCTSVQYVFENLEPGTHTVFENVSVDGLRVVSTTYTFDGTSGTNTIPIAEPPGSHRIDARAQWRSHQIEGRQWAGWDITSHRTCGRKEAPGYVIQKRQHIAGEGGFVPTPVVGTVGQVVLYEIVVTNTGNVPLAFGELSDPKCDPGTLTGSVPGGVLGPGAAAKFTCAHTITEADQTLGSYTNVASITGTPVGGAPIPETSNTVVVEVPPPGVVPPGSEVGGGGAGGSGGGGPTATPTTLTGEVSVLASTASGGGASAEAARVPALSGAPVGCARPSFVLSVKSKNVRKVTFYLDNHRLKSLTAKSARHGKLSIRVNTSRLKVGRHRVKARIVMAPTAARAKTVVAARTITFVRCAAATLSPHFTG